MSKPLIVHVITNFSAIGGAEMMLSRLIKSTDDKYQHIIISLMDISDVFQGTLVYCCRSYALGWNGLNTFSIIKKLRYLLVELHAQVVQCWMYHANVLTSLSILGLKQKIKVIWGIHHSLASPKDESISTKIALALSKILSSKPNTIIYCAYSSLEQHKKFGFSNSNQYVIVNGVFLENFKFNNNLNNPLVIGFAGRYHNAKGYPYLFETMYLLKDKNIIFKVAGNGASLENSEVKYLFEKYNLDTKKVRLLGQIDDMPNFYESLDLFLMTSITEGFPNVLVEAMASGIPCVSTDVGDAKYIVANFGLITSPRSAQELANAIQNYIDKSDQEKLGLKKAVRQRVENNFSIDSVSQQYKELWEK